jgi:hypothetical protein
MIGACTIGAAATLLPFSIFVIAGSAAAARFLARHRNERIIAAGLGLIGMGIAIPLLDPASAVPVGSGMAMAGFGIGLSSVATTSMATDVREQSRATASGIVNTSAQPGTAIGTAVAVAVRGGHDRCPRPHHGGAHHRSGRVRDTRHGRGSSVHSIPHGGVATVVGDPRCATLTGTPSQGNSARILPAVDLTLVPDHSR